ncbi:hypothetical protein B5S31_g4708 [[Candida] boidinii]|nr:hypothetical protein B5S31_g4708 [[Candida] boidinii]
MIGIKNLKLYGKYFIKLTKFQINQKIDNLFTFNNNQNHHSNFTTSTTNITDNNSNMKTNLNSNSNSISITSNNINSSYIINHSTNLSSHNINANAESNNTKKRKNNNNDDDKRLSKINEIIEINEDEKFTVLQSSLQVFEKINIKTVYLSEIYKGTTFELKMI